MKEVMQWDGLLVARTGNSDLLLARLELLTKEEAWLPLLTQLTVVGFDISQAGELWVVVVVSPTPSWPTSSLSIFTPEK